MYSNKTINVFETLSKNSYPGRTIIMGLSEKNEAVMIYFIMGRSDNSRNRIFVEEGDNLKIEPFDVSLVEDPSLIIYYPVRKLNNNYIVTNGDQTDTINEFMLSGKTFEEALATRCFEPDSPNFTPRISGLLKVENENCNYTLSILKRQAYAGENCQRQYFEYLGEKGFGHIIHTYEGDGNPLPSFEGEPGRISISGNFDEYVNKIWDSLNKDNKISLYAKIVDLNTKQEKVKIINRFNK